MYAIRSYYDPMLFIEMKGVRGEAQRIKKGKDGRTEHAALIRLDDGGFCVVKLVRRLLDPGGGVGQAVIKKKFGNEIVPAIIEFNFHPDLRLDRDRLLLAVV